MNLLYLLKYLYRRPQHLIIRFFSDIFSRKINVVEMDNVLIVSPHPDDEIFGCANLIYTLSKLGNRVNIIYLSRGEASLPSSCIDKRQLIETRKELAIRANSVLGMDSCNLFFLDFPDGKFKNVSSDQVNKFQEIIERINPQYVFYPHPYDGSPDHSAATKYVRDVIEGKNIKQYYYCVWLWHHMPLYKVFLLNYFQSYYIYGDLSLKKEAIDIYVKALTESGLPYSGTLPKMFLKAIYWKKELFFKVV